jgi:hypothetical protein
MQSAGGQGKQSVRQGLSLLCSNEHPAEGSVYDWKTGAALSGPIDSLERFATY